LAFFYSDIYLEYHYCVFYISDCIYRVLVTEQHVLRYNLFMMSPTFLGGDRTVVYQEWYCVVLMTQSRLLKCHMYY